ncbi:MAG: thioredoxin domain-containing protein [bacterium]
MAKHIITALLIMLFYSSCKTENSQQMKHEFTNDLINETSPYLLQHAHNPVNWKPWSDDALDEAKASNKLILISVGYAACHWCHVMERESFEDSLVAKVMNDNFVNIKVDREERPDIDQVYMSAVQLMTGSGGWPLNVIALPDGRPIWGGTYFKKEHWLNALEQIQETYLDQPEKLAEYATKLEEGIKTIDLVQLNTNPINFETSQIKEALDKWSVNFDTIYGGMRRQQKFMMPSNLNFLLRYAYQKDDIEIMNYVNTTLTKMAYGGVYDQLGGGFSRYSVDTRWHVPHFEKMLYDNAQLVLLYSDAYLVTKNNLYKEIVSHTLDFIEREFTTEEGTFYSSYDADSNNDQNELVEGAFYVWKKDQLKELLGSDYLLFEDYYNINDFGLWEHEQYVLIRTTSDELFAEKHNLTLNEVQLKVKSWREKLMKIRDQRARPRLDDKVLTSWNALMIQGYVKAYTVFGDASYLDAAKKNANFILNKQLRSDGGLNHSYKDGKSTINGYLEDYASVIEAFIDLYEVTFDENWLTIAKQLADYSFDHFYDENSKMFFFTSDEDRSLVNRSVVYRDNVIPASNSIMAKSLFKLYHYFDNEYYLKTSKAMLNNVQPELLEYPEGFTNWMDLMLNFSENYYEVAIVGSELLEERKTLGQTYLPNIVLIGSTEDNDMPLLKNRYVEGQTLIYVCVNKACKLPVTNVDKALEFVQ